MANAKISNSSVFIPKSDVLDVDGFAGYNSSGNVQISGTNLKSSILSGTITTVTGTAPISVTSGSTPVVSISQATTSSNGYLSSTDWNTFNNKTSNLGTVTEVSASISGSAYTASVSNSTTTPSISISPQGTSSQYINGAGNLTTFPTLPTVNDNTITLTAGTGLSGGGDFTLNQGSDKTITFNNTITNNNQLTNGAGYITSSSLPTVGNGTLTITVDGTPTTFSANQSTNTNLSFTTGSGTSIAVKDEGTQITSGVTSFNFVGAGVTATNSSNDVTVTIPGGSSGSGTVTNVSALTLGTSGTDLTSTVVNSTTTPVITLNVPSASATNRGVLTSSDWSTFNSKTDNTGTVTQIIASSPLTGGTITNSGTIGIPQADTSTSGYLTSSDWNTFNGKTSFAEPAIFSGGGTPTLATGVTGLEIRSLIGAGTSSFSGAYADLTGKPTIPTNNNQLTNGAGYITSASLPTVNDGQLTITVDGTATTFTANQSGNSSVSITTGSSDNFYVTGASYSAGTLTLTRNGGLANVTATGFLQIGSSSTTALAGDTTTITTAQANEITANTAKVSANNSAITLTAGTGLTGGGSFNLNQSAAQEITFNASGSAVDTIYTANASDTSTVPTGREIDITDNISFKTAADGGYFELIGTNNVGMRMYANSASGPYINNISFENTSAADSFIKVRANTNNVTLAGVGGNTPRSVHINPVSAPIAAVQYALEVKGYRGSGTMTDSIITDAGSDTSSNFALTTRDKTGNNIFRVRGDKRIVYTDGNESAGYVLTCDANGVGTWQASGGSGGSGFPSAVTASSTAATSAAVDTFYTITTTSGVADIVVTLPTAASNSGKIIGVKYAAQNSVDDTVLIKTVSSQTIDGTNRTTNGLPLASVGTYYEVISDGANWWIK